MTGVRKPFSETRRGERVKYRPTITLLTASIAPSRSLLHFDYWRCFLIHTAFFSSTYSHPAHHVHFTHHSSPLQTPPLPQPSPTPPRLPRRISSRPVPTARFNTETKRRDRPCTCLRRNSMQSSTREIAAAAAQARNCSGACENL